MLSDAERASRLVGELTREVDEILQGTTSLSVKAHDAPGPRATAGDPPRVGPRVTAADLRYVGRHLDRADAIARALDGLDCLASPSAASVAAREDPSLEGVRRARERATSKLGALRDVFDAIERAAAPDVLADADVAPRAPPSDAAAAAAVGSPPQPPTASPSPTHRTTLLRPPPPAVVPSLANLALATLATNADAIADVSPLDEICATALLREIMRRGKLTTPIARVFIGSGHQELAEAVSQLNLFAGIRPGTGFAPRTRPFPG